MILILHYLEDPKLWDLWYIPYYGVMQDLHHQPYGRGLEIVNLAASFKDMEDAGRSRPVGCGG